MSYGIRCVALLLVIVAAGCGAADPAERYLGTWTFASGTDNVSCPNGNTAAKLSGNVTVKRATDGSLLVLDPEGCNFTYALDGQSAKTNARSCTFPVPELGAGVTAAAGRGGFWPGGGTLMDAPAGNTGVGLALVAATRGYRLVCVMPEKMSPDKRRQLETLGARVIITPNRPLGDAENFQTVAAQL